MKQGISPPLGHRQAPRTPTSTDVAAGGRVAGHPGDVEEPGVTAFVRATDGRPGLDETGHHRRECSNAAIASRATDRRPGRRRAPSAKPD